MKWFSAICLLVVVFAIAEIYAEPCTPGEKKQEDCNTCTCIGDGTGFACTRRQCHRKRSTEAECTVGESKTENCNECNCVGKGIWACTKNICKDKRATQICTPHSTFAQDCNTCTCNENGQHAACTQKLCL